MRSNFRYPVFVVLLNIFLGGFTYSSEKMVEQAKFEYEVMTVELLKPVKQLDSLYLENLDGLKKEEIQRGALESVLLIKAIEKAIQIGSEIPQVDQSQSELFRLHSIYMETREKRLKIAEPALKDLRSSYISKLEGYVKALTQDSKIEEAVQLSQYIAKVKSENSVAPLKVNKSEGEAGRVFDLVNGEFCGTKFGDSEEEVRTKMEVAGLPIKGESTMNGGKNISQSMGINFRLDKKGIYFQNYLLGSEIPLPGGLQLGESTVEDFETVLDERARKQEPRKFLIKTKNCELLLIKETEGASEVDSVMVTER